MIRMRIAALLVGLVAGLLPGARVDAADKPGDWPQFHGNNRDNISSATGLMKKWPEGGPKLLWSAPCGMGYSAVSIADGLIYTAGTEENDFGPQVISAFDFDGKLKWKTPNGKTASVTYPGARSTPTIADGVAYHLSCRGRVAAVDAKEGKELWAVDVLERFGAKVLKYGMAESVLVDGDNVICTPGGEKGYMVALNRKTGATVWANTDIGENASYSSAIAFDFGGVRQVATFMAKSIVGVDAKTGTLLWKYPFATLDDCHASRLTYNDGFLFAPAAYAAGAAGLKLGAAGGGKIEVEQVWRHEKDFDNRFQGGVLVDGHVYATGHQVGAGWFCIEMKTGKMKLHDALKGGNKDNGMLLYADGLFYCLTHYGRMMLVRGTPEKFEVVSEFTITTPGCDPKARDGKYWFQASPVICDGRLYIRHASTLYCYEIREK